MPRPRNDLPTLKLRKARYSGKGSLTHKAQYFIYDRGQQHFTGIGPDDPGAAEAAKAALRAYVAKRHAEEVAKPKKAARTPPEETLIADVIAYYSLKTSPRYEPSEANPGGDPNQKRDFLFRMNALLDYWGEKVVDDIDMETCAEFSKLHATSTARRCLEDLRSACNIYVKARKMASGGDYVFDLPAPNPPRYGFFTRGQMARLVWAAYRKKQTYTYSGKRARDENRGKTIETAGRPRRHIARFLLTAVATGSRTSRIERASFYPEPGRPWIDVERGIFYRAWKGEFVPTNKGADPVHIPGRLLAHMRRWKKQGARYLIEHKEGKTGSTASAFFRHLRETLSEEEISAMDLNRHALKHTCATWLCMDARPMGEIAGYLSTSSKTIERHYGHHHPDHHRGIGDSFTTGSAGRLSFGREAKAPGKPTAASHPAVAAEVRRSVRELLEAFQAPVVAFGILSAVPDAGLEGFRESVKRAGRSGDWAAVLGKEKAPEDA